MIAYVDPTALARAYLVDEDGHAEARQLLADPQTALVTGAWTRVQVAAALLRAAGKGTADERGLLSLLEADLSRNGSIAVVSAPEDNVVEQAWRLIRRHRMQLGAAYHVATAVLTLPALAEPQEHLAFASHDQALLRIAAGFGLKSMRIATAGSAAPSSNTASLRPLHRS